MKTFLVQDMGTKESNLWSLPQILEEINKDRSSEWTDYDESDYVEGWCEWVEGEYFSCKEIKKKYLQEKISNLYEIAEKIDPDTASVISMAEDTLRKSK